MKEEKRFAFFSTFISRKLYSIRNGILWNPLWNLIVSFNPFFSCFAYFMLVQKNVQIIQKERRKLSLSYFPVLSGIQVLFSRFYNPPYFFYFLIQENIILIFPLVLYLCFLLFSFFICLWCRVLYFTR